MAVFTWGLALIGHLRQLLLVDIGRHGAEVGSHFAHHLGLWVSEGHCITTSWTAAPWRRSLSYPWGVYVGKGVIPSLQPGQPLHGARSLSYPWGVYVGKGKGGCSPIKKVLRHMYNWKMSHLLAHPGAHASDTALVALSQHALAKKQHKHGSGSVQVYTLGSSAAPSTP